MSRPQIWHPFTQLQDFEPIGEVVRAEGAWLHLADGRRLLDGIASWWVSWYGHSHPHVVAAVQRQVATLDQVILADFTHAPARQLTEALRARLPRPLDHIFFSDDGSTAMEVALKLAWQAQRKRDPRRFRLVYLDGSYHGDTVGAMSIGARDVFTAPFDGLLSTAHALPWEDPDAAEAWLDAHGHEVIAVFVEPLLQGAGGMRVGRPGTLRRLAHATRRAGALLVADEVATGFGRTGTFFAFEQAGIVPDLVALSKALTAGALPMGVTAVSESLYAAFLGPTKPVAFLHGHSFTGNPLGCAAALAGLELYDALDVPGRVARMAALYAARAPALRALPGVTDVRWLGAMLAVDLDGAGYTDPVGSRVQAACVARGLYLRPLGSVAYLLPPVVITDAELAWALDVLADAIRDVRPS